MLHFLIFCLQLIFLYQRRKIKILMLKLVNQVDRYLHPLGKRHIQRIVETLEVTAFEGNA